MCRSGPSEWGRGSSGDEAIQPPAASSRTRRLLGGWSGALEVRPFPPPPRRHLPSFLVPHLSLSFVSFLVFLAVPPPLPSFTFSAFPCLKKDFSLPSLFLPVFLKLSSFSWLIVLLLVLSSRASLRLLFLFFLHSILAHSSHPFFSPSRSSLPRPDVFLISLAHLPSLLSCSLPPTVSPPLSPASPSLLPSCLPLHKRLFLSSLPLPPPGPPSPRSPCCSV